MTTDNIEGTEIIDGHEKGYFQDRKKLKDAKRHLSNFRSY
jgi:hypothetical protein